MSKSTNEAIRRAKSAADELGLRGEERHDFLRDYIQPRPSNIHKRARAAVYEAATRDKWWQKGQDSLGRARRFWASIFPFLRRRYNDAIGRWYKANIKQSKRNLVADFRDGTLAEHERIKRKAARIRRKEARLNIQRELKSYVEGDAGDKTFPGAEST